MSKTIVLNLGQGDLQAGFPRVTATLWSAGHSLPEQIIGSLPPAPYIVELYRNWQSIYQNLCNPFQCQGRSSVLEDNDDIEIDEMGVTNVSTHSFQETCQSLQNVINTWLKSREFLNIERHLRTQLDPKEEIRIIVETNDTLLRKLPWHRWDFFGDYPKAEIALSRPEYKRSSPSPKIRRNKVRILAILGNSQGINLEAEAKFLQSLADAEVVFLVKPSRQEFNKQLWHPQGWDILFFAGHSQTEGETGRIYINENSNNNSLTIEQLEEALKAAIENGLKLAIFNSCDGLGLAFALEKLNIPTVIVMREPVPNRVAQDFFRDFLFAFAHQRLPLYLSLQQARRKLQGLEDEFPGASWLPVICQNPAVQPPNWLNLGGIPPCPYRGLFAFKEEDAHLFFGREKLTHDLLLGVRKKPLVAVVGASGSGKSSIVFAGVVTKLRSQYHEHPPLIVSFRPGNNPFESLGIALAAVLTQDSNEDELRLLAIELEISLRSDDKALYKIINKLSHCGEKIILIADQFEEIYTNSSESEQKLFLDGLLKACNDAVGFTLILTLRADFYGYALSYRPFCSALQGSVYNIGPMNRDELQSVIEKPVAQVQVALEKGLTNKLLDAVEGESGTLPLLEFALTQLWDKQKDGLLTHEAYEEIGGVDLALANHAEYVYARLDDAHRKRTRQVFMQLVHLSEDTVTTRRLASRNDFQEINWNLVKRLADARLVVTNRSVSTEVETVEIVHEALIKSWGRLENWINVDGEFRRWQEQLRGCIRQWDNSENDEGGLLRGKPLADAQYWLKLRQDELSALEASFINLSLELQQREIQKRNSWRRRIISSLAGGLVITSSLTGIAWWQSRQASINEVKALSTSAEALFVSDNSLDAMVEAIKAKNKLKGIAFVPPDIREKLDAVVRKVVYGAVEYNRLRDHKEKVNTVAFSKGGELIATASDDLTAKLWNKNGVLLATFKGHNDRVYAAAISSGGETVATGSGDKTVKLWKRDGTLIDTIEGYGDRVSALAFSQDGKILVSASWDGNVRLRTTNGVEIILKHGGRVTAVAISDNGQIIASSGEDKTVKLWNRDGILLTTLKGHSDAVSAVAISPDGKTIASASWDKTVKLWSIDGKLITTLSGHNGRVFTVAFAPKGDKIASAGWDRTVKIWKSDGTFLTNLNGHIDTIWNVAFNPQGDKIASASSDKTVKLWKLNNELITILQGHTDSVMGVALHPQGNKIATASDDNSIKLWSLDGAFHRTIKGHNIQVWDVAFSPDGNTIASTGRDNKLKLWDLNGKLLKTLWEHNGSVNSVAYSPDGQIIASASDDKAVKLWKADGTLLKKLEGHKDEVWTVAFSNDSQIIISASRDKTIKLWRRDGTLIKTLDKHTCPVISVAVNPRVNIFATGDEGGFVKIWRLDGTLINTLPPQGDTIRAIAYSPDGEKLATSEDKTVKLWKSDGTLITTLKAHRAAVWDIAFSKDGKNIVSTSEDKTAIIWNLDKVVDLNTVLGYGNNWISDYLKTK